MIIPACLIVALCLTIAIREILQDFYNWREIKRKNEWWKTGDLSNTYIIDGIRYPQPPADKIDWWTDSLGRLRYRMK